MASAKGEPHPLGIIIVASPHVKVEALLKWKAQEVKENNKIDRVSRCFFVVEQSKICSWLP